MKQTKRPKPGHMSQQTNGFTGSDHRPMSPSMFRLQGLPKVLQAKIHSGANPAALCGRSIGYVSGGVVQANVVGGNHALQARLNLWNTRLTRGENCTVKETAKTSF